MSLRLFQLVAEGVSEEEALRSTTTVDCSVEPSRTKAEFAEDADINVIWARFQKTGHFPSVEEMGGPQPMYGDFSSGEDFLAAATRVKEAQESFELLPAGVRERFRNDPKELLDFVSDEGNRAEALELGLVEDKRAQEARLARERASDVKARELEAAEQRGRESAKPSGQQ